MQHDEFKFEIATFQCPIVNPPAQRHMFANKLHNIQLAIDRMQGLVLAPDEDFSFWQYALAPNKKNGYREGAMFINHKVRSSIGGGLCQLSGVLYNLSLLAGCHIIERYNHSIDAYGEKRYIPLGQDCTVAYGHKNLCFKNVHHAPIQLRLAVDEHFATGSIWSSSPLTKHVSIQTHYVQTFPPPIRKRPIYLTKAKRHDLNVHNMIEEGLVGHHVEAYRTFTYADGAKETALLSRDTYRATPTKVFYHSSNPFNWLTYLLKS